MEEKEKMEAGAGKPEKMTYEQLENVAHQLSEQARQLYARLQEADMTNVFRRLDYLFKVIENQHVFPEDFVEQCVNEITELITIPKESEIQSEDSPVEE